MVKLAMDVFINYFKELPLIVYLAAFAVMVVFTFLLRIGSRSKFGVGLSRVLFFLLVGLVVALIFSLSMNFYTYHRLTHEQELATVEVKKLEEQLYEVTVVLSKEPDYRRTYELKGDEWQIDAQVLKWKGWAQLLGLNSLYRLDRLSGRYQDIEQARENLPTLYSLRAEQGIDVWGYAKEHPDQLPFVDATYGSATYLPMYDGAMYQVSLSQTGLLARLIE